MVKIVAIFLILPQKHIMWVFIIVSNDYPQYMVLWRSKKNPLFSGAMVVKHYIPILSSEYFSTKKLLIFLILP